MPLELRPTSKYWYGRVQVNEKRTLIPLKILVQGRPPTSLREEGDPPFERSRALAQAKLDEVEKQLRERGNEQAIAERLLYLKQGVQYQEVKLAEMFKAWLALSPGKQRSTRYLAQVESLCEKFVAFAAHRVPPALEMAQVSSVLAADFVRVIESTAVTGKTRNEQVNRLKTIFKDLADKTGVIRNPFGQIKKLPVETVHRQPLTIPEITAVLDAAKDDPFARQLIVVALCTAMRRCDCCLIQFGRIEWAERVISVKPAKRGAWVKIPIFGLLERELAPIFEKGTHRNSDYVLPEHAAMFKSNPDGVTLRIKKVFERAGFSWTDDEEGATGRAMSVKRAQGVRRASTISLHSLRTSWITLALLAGVPVELVKRVTGQHSTDVILTYYFQPLQSQIREALLAKLPPLLTGKPIEAIATQVRPDLVRVLDLLSAMNDSNWREQRDKAVAEIRPHLVDPKQTLQLLPPR